jgi:hypothetical protein
MREEEFRRRFQATIGEPPPMAAPVLRGPAAAATRNYPRAMALLAAAVAILLILVLVGSRIALQPRGYLSPVSTPRVAQLPPDSMPCHLAVNMVQDANNAGGGPSATASTMGFVNIPAGTFEADPAARVSDLPPGNSNTPKSYSGALHRWLPVQAQLVSPDGRSYAYSKGAELHVVDAASHADRKVWTAAGNIEVRSWDPGGILLFTLTGYQDWYVDPTSGSAVQTLFSGAQLEASKVLPSGGPYSDLGTDALGRTVWRFGGRGGNGPEKVYVIEAGQATLIYSGTAGDGNDFDPEGVFTDAHGLWLGNFDGRYVWLWTHAGGLRSYKTSGGPPAPAGYQTSTLTFLPEGPCVPGTFHGAPPSPLPAAGPVTPSPSPPTVDWAPLLAKPVTLQDLQPGQACPVSGQVSLQVKARPGSGKWPNYGFGPGPAYVSGQTIWYSAGSQAIVVVTDPSYRGPVLIRTKRLDGAGSVTITGDGDSLAGGAFGIRQTSSPPYWGTWYGPMTPTAPGCYGIQLDGTSFSAVVVIEVKQGPPPPG